MAYSLPLLLLICPFLQIAHSAPPLVLPLNPSYRDEYGLFGGLSFSYDDDLMLDSMTASASMNVFVLPSAQPEPFGGVVLEAMALELPVVATALGGSIEQVVEGVTGFLVAPADPKAIADRLEKLAQSPALCQQFGHAGRERIQTVLSLDRAVVGIEAAYTELLQSNPTQR